MNYYEILGVSREATPKEIKKAYKNLANKYHPDKATGDPEKFDQINKAYNALKDSTARTIYDHGVSDDHLAAEVSKVLNDVFMSVIEGGMTQGDIIATCRHLVKEQLPPVATGLQEYEDRLESLQSLKGRVKNKKGSQIFEKILTDKIANLEKTISQGENVVTVLNCVLSILGDFEDTEVGDYSEFLEYCVSDL